MANNVLVNAFVRGTGSPAPLSANDNGDGTWTILVTTDVGDTVLLIPGLVQAGQQNQFAPIMAKANGDGSYKLCVTSG